MQEKSQVDCRASEEVRAVHSCKDSWLCQEVPACEQICQHRHPHHHLHHRNRVLNGRRPAHLDSIFLRDGLTHRHLCLQHSTLPANSNDKYMPRPNIYFASRPLTKDPKTPDPRHVTQGKNEFANQDIWHRDVCLNRGKRGLCTSKNSWVIYQLCESGFKVCERVMRVWKSNIQIDVWIRVCERGMYV